MLKTILTYLELDGFLEQGTPFYAGYSVRPAGGEWDDVYAAFDQAAPSSCDVCSRAARRGASGRASTPTPCPARNVSAWSKRFGYLEQQGLVELKVADVRQRFTLS